MQHQSVMMTEVIEGLALASGSIAIDATYGRGGHSATILETVGAGGKLMVIDRDPKAIADAEQKYASANNVLIEQGAFSELGDFANKHQLNGKVNGILFDLGVSSPQLDEPQRGFSFQKEGPLDMRMNPLSGISAAEWLATAAEEDIRYVLKTYGEERFAKKIAATIVQTRQQQPITTTLELANLIDACIPFREKNKHPATRSFQAIRIFVNQELEEVQSALKQALDILAVGGRLAVISFHSLEDRIVKQFFQQQVQGANIPSKLPILEADIPRRLKHIAKKVRASEEEVANNPRARSAVLRVVEKLA